MSDIHLYRYPFDDQGRQSLTFAETLAAMRELHRQLDAMLRADWRWCDLRLSIVERHPTYMAYEVQHLGAYIGRVVVIPNSAEPPRIGPGSTLDELALLDRIRNRRKPEKA